MQSARRTVIGVFAEGAMADQAISALEAAGFSDAQIHRHGHHASSGGFLAGLRKLFGGGAERDNTDDSDFTDLGLSNEEASYYEGEADGGRQIISVVAEGREEEAMSILRTNGAYNYGMRHGGSGLASAATTETAADATGTAGTMGSRDADTYYDQNRATGSGSYRDADRTGATYDNTTARTTDAGAYDTATTDTTRTYDNTTDRPVNRSTYDTATTDTNAPGYDTSDRTRRTVGTTGAADMSRDAGSADYSTTDTDNTRRMPLREEQLDVNKERVQTGEVGLHKDIVSEEKSINVPVTHEEAYIERRPVSDATANDNTPIGEGETVRVPLSEEQVNVNKNTVTTGEVEVGKRAVQENQRVSDTVRREEARMERDGDVNVRGTQDDRFQTDRTDDRNL